MKTSIKIKLTSQESRELRRQKAPHREVIRAQIILLLSRRESFAATSRRIGVARRIVYKWANRFLIERMAGLKDRCRSGRPARFSPDRVDVPDQAGVRTSGRHRAPARDAALQPGTAALVARIAGVSRIQCGAEVRQWGGVQSVPSVKGISTPGDLLDRWWSYRRFWPRDRR